MVTASGGAPEAVPPGPGFMKPNSGRSCTKQTAHTGLLTASTMGQRHGFHTGGEGWENAAEAAPVEAEEARKPGSGTRSRGREVRAAGHSGARWNTPGKQRDKVALCRALGA